MINVRNTQRRVNLDLEQIENNIHKMLSSLGYEEFDVGVWFTTNATIRRYNKLYRGKDKATDVLSFPYHRLKPGERVEILNEEDRNLGDIIISPEYVKKDAPSWGHNFKERINVLLAHGIAHLLGYDHQTDEEYKVMQRLENKLLKTLKQTRNPL